MSIAATKKKIERIVYEQIETNSVATLERLVETITERLNLKRSAETQSELKALTQALYTTYDRDHDFNYDDVLAQTFPASDPPPPPPIRRPRA